MNRVSQFAQEAPGPMHGRIRRLGSGHRRQTLGHDLFNGLIQWWPVGYDRERGSHGDAFFSTGAYDGITDGPGGMVATNFNGTGKWLNVTSDSRFDGGDRDFTVCGWIRSSSVSSGPYLCGIWTNVAGHRSHSLQIHNTGCYFYYEQGTTTGWTQNATAPANNTWTFLCGRSDSVNNTWDLRVNGTDASSALTGGCNAGTGDYEKFGIGRQGQGLDDLTPKDICGVGFWNRVLTVAEMDYLYNGGVGRKYPFV